MTTRNSIEVTDAVALEALANLSPDAKQLVWGMIIERAQDTNCGHCGSFQSAFATGGGAFLLPEVVTEVAEAGILRMNDEGTSYVLHSMFSQIGQNMCDRSQRVSEETTPFNVLTIR